MGIYDRDYIREYSPRSGRRRGGNDWMMVTKIIVVNAALFLINGLLTGDRNELTYFLSIHGSTIYEPLMYWRFLTYGFVHDPTNIWHVAGNMIGLFCLGYEVERRLGSREFLYFYLSTILFGGLFWGAINANNIHNCLGASGGVVGVVILYAIFYPHRMLMLYGIIPIPAWAIGVFIVGSDLLGYFNVVRMQGESVAYPVHLAGAAFAFMYYNDNWNFTKAIDGFKRRLPTWKSTKPKMSVVRPEEDIDAKPDSKNAASKKTEEQLLSEKVDEILKKYSRYGESSLTEEEREILKKASSTYQKKYKM